MITRLGFTVALASLIATPAFAQQQRPNIALVGPSPRTSGWVAKAFCRDSLVCFQRSYESGVESRHIGDAVESRGNSRIRA